MHELILGVDNCGKSCIGFCIPECYLPWFMDIHGYYIQVYLWCSFTFMNVHEYSRYKTGIIHEYSRIYTTNIHELF